LRRFDPEVPATRALETALGRDPKGPWEVGRMAHLVPLGVAAQLVPDCAAELRAAFYDQIADFADHNPVGRGVQWASPLEVALRAIHLLGAFHLLGGARESAPAALRGLARLLLEHGRFLAENLEDRGVVAGSHLVGNLCGLLWLGVAL